MLQNTGSYRYSSSQLLPTGMQDPWLHVTWLASQYVQLQVHLQMRQESIPACSVPGRKGTREYEFATSPHVDVPMSLSTGGSKEKRGIR